MKDAYTEFLESKVKLAETWGFKIEDSEINPILKPHQRATVKWMVEGGRRACFAAFGLGKSVIQLEAVRLTRDQTGGRALIVIPLGVRQEFIHDALMLGIQVKFIRRISEVEDDGIIYLTNYETIRDGKLDPAEFSVASLDEASVLRGLGSTKTFREFMRTFTGDAGPTGKRNQVSRVSRRFVATATPSPNDYIELLSYAAFLGIMDVSQAKTRFFKRDSTKADVLTIHPHKETEFWMWVSSWALFIQKPSDLGFSDEGYVLPELDVRWHEVATDHKNARPEKNGQNVLFRDAALSLPDAAEEKRNSLPQRVEKLLEIRAEDPEAHRIYWHDQEIERAAIKKAIPGVVTVQGKDTDEHKEQSIIGFSNGTIAELAGKPCMLGSGCNFQRHCSWAVYLGIGFKFNDFIQSIHRLQRFLQTGKVRIDIIYTEAERGVRKQLERKWKQHIHQVQTMTEIIKKHGLSHADMSKELTRKLGVERVEITGERYTIVNNDNVLESKSMQTDSIGLILTSIPFATQYEYSPNYADFGHSEGNEEFFKQMDFLTPEMLRVLQPGRICAIHVKDRIVPGGMTGLGFQTVYPFHARCIDHYVKHGFGYMGMKTIVTDVVRENNQTYRLGWTEQCKDGTKMGVGMPEYLLLFRKPPTSNENSYADIPVVKSKGDYTRARWQVDAHGFTRSSGNRLLTPDEIAELKHSDIFKAFKETSLTKVYDFEHHVKIGETIDAKGKLPVKFMLLQPQSWSDDVWTDITRMLTLNGAQSAKGKEMHLCPMQFDLADRVIDQFSMPGEKVWDPFGGLMTVPYRAIKKGRYGIGTELNPAYFLDGAAYCKAAEEEMAMPELFDLEPESMEGAA
ncbi:MAG: DNA methyltransferase [Luteolibacter sp.]